MRYLQLGLQVIIVVIVSVNLLLTLNLYRGQDTEESHHAGITVQQAREMGQKVVGDYNSRDIDRLYARFSPKARIKLEKQALQSQLESLHDVFGDISAIDYRSQMKLGEQQHETYHQLFFDARVSNPGIGQARLVLSVILEQDSILLYGVSLKSTMSP